MSPFPAYSRFPLMVPLYLLAPFLFQKVFVHAIRFLSHISGARARYDRVGTDFPSDTDTSVSFWSLRDLLCVQW